jgi:hypothetical protein
VDRPPRKDWFVFNSWSSLSGPERHPRPGLRETFPPCRLRFEAMPVRVSHIGERTSRD